MLAVTKKAPPKKGGKKRPAKKKKVVKPAESPKKPEKQYTEEDLKRAIALVKSGESAWKISRQYGIRYNILAAATKTSMYGSMYTEVKKDVASREKNRPKEESSNEKKVGDTGRDEN